MTKEIRIAYLLTILAGLSFGSIPIFAALLRNNNASSIEQTFIRLFFGAAVAFIFVLIYALNRPVEVRKSFSHSLHLMYGIQGIVFVLMIITYISSVALHTPAGEAALLVQVQPFITIVLSRIILKENITKEKIIALILAIIGIVILTRPWDWDNFLQSFWGSLLAIANGCLYSCYILLGRSQKEQRKDIDSLVSISWVLIYGFITSFPLLLLLNILPLPVEINKFSFDIIFTPIILFYGILLTVCGSLLPYTFLMISSKKVDASKAAILRLNEPVGAIFLGVLVLHEPITLWYVLGGLTILSAVIYIVISTKHNSDKLKKNSKKTAL